VCKLPGILFIYSANYNMGRPQERESGESVTREQGKICFKAKNAPKFFSGMVPLGAN